MAKRFGMNIAGPGENFENTYADALRQHRGWCKPELAWALDAAIPVDKVGEPLADFATCAPVMSQLAVPYLAGTYELSFFGQAKVEVTVGPGSVQRQNYHQPTNTTTALVIVPPTNTNLLGISFTQTRRRPSDRPGTGLARIKLMRPISVGSPYHHQRDELFSRDWLTAVRQVELIRGMDWLGINNYGGSTTYRNATWAARTLPTFSNQLAIPGRVGACLEDLIEAANLANVDLYINIPDTADVDYITKLMQLVAFGGDGLNPYSSPHARPAYRGLKPGLKFYFAWSNEVWNYSFPQFHRNEAEAKTEVAAGGSPLNFDGTTDVVTWYKRRVGEHLKGCSVIARAVFGDAAMMTRVRPILESFLADSNTLAIPLDFLNKFYNNGDGKTHVADPHPPSYYIWGGGGAGYRTTGNKSLDEKTVTAKQLFASGLEPVSHVTDVQILAGYGLEHASYEMGFEIGDAAFNEFTSKLTSDPRCRPLAQQTLTDYYADGGSLGVIYSLSVGNWRNLDAIGNLNHPKFLGLKDARANPPSDAVHIPAVPSAEPNPPFYGKFRTGDVLFTRSYRFPTGGYLAYTLSGHQAGAAGTPSIGVSVDGHPTATGELIPDRLGGGRSLTRPLIVPVGPGLHTIRVAVAGPLEIPFGAGGGMTFSPSPPPTEVRTVLAAADFAGPAGTAAPKLPEASRWVKQSTDNDFVATGAGGLRITGAGYGNEVAHYLNFKPPTPDYEVAATFDMAQPDANRFFLTIRAGITPGDHGYCGGVIDNTFQIYNHTTNTGLATNGANLKDFAGTIRLRLRATGPVIQLFVNDFEVCRATDSKYTQAGFGGFYFAQNRPSPTVIRSFELATVAATTSNLVASLVRLEPGATRLTLVAGRPQTMAVKVTPPPAFTGSITLRLDDLPGVVAAFDPPTLAGAGASTLTLIPADATRFAPRPLLITALAGPASLTTTGTVEAVRTSPPGSPKVSLLVPPGIIGVTAQGEVSLNAETPSLSAIEANLDFTGAVVPESITIPAGSTFACFDCTPTAPAITGAVALENLAGWATARQIAFEATDQDPSSPGADRPAATPPG